MSRRNISARLEGILCMGAAAIGFAFMNVCAKAASGRVPALEIAAARALVGVPLVLVYAWVRGISLGISNRRVAAVRVAAGTIAMALTFYALSAAPVAEASALLNLTPMFVALFGVLWLGERVSLAVAGCLLLGLLGTMLVFRPQQGALGAGGWAAVGAAVTAAVSMVTLRKLGATETPEAVVAVFLSGSGLLLGLASLPSLVIPTGREGLLMAGAGVSATVGQIAMTRAYALEEAARVGGMNYLNIVASLLLAALFFGERPGPLSLIGIAVILLSGGVLAWTSSGKAAAPAGRASGEV